MAGMGAMPVVLVGPCRQALFALFRAGIRACIDPLPQSRLNEPPGLAIGSGGIGPGVDMFDAKPSAGPVKLFLACQRGQIYLSSCMLRLTYTPQINLSPLINKSVPFDTVILAFSAMAPCIA
jgi:hypothetical protein